MDFRRDVGITGERRVKCIVGFRVGKLSAAMGIAVAALSAVCDSAKAQRVLGLDVSRHQGQISQANWNTTFSDAGGSHE